MPLNGKGFFIWQIHNVEAGNPAAIANKAAAAGLSHVLVKIADGNYPVNLHPQTKIDLAPAVAQALKAKNIQVWGWHYVYGYDPLGEAQIAIRRIQQLNLDGYVIDAEAEYKEPGRDTAARRFMNELRRRLPDSFPIALSSFRFPTYHPQLPWKAFLEYCNYNMPQVYWEKAHNPARQLERCVRELLAIHPSRPVIPTGPTYKHNGWAPTSTDMLEFLDTTRAMGLTAANFFSWDECCRDLKPLWETLSNYSWQCGAPAVNLDVVEQLFSAMNQQDSAQAAGLYNANAVQVSAAHTLIGQPRIQQYYNDFLTEKLPGAEFTLGKMDINGAMRHFRWNARANNGKIATGSDTIGLAGDKIAYHFTNFTVSSS